MSFHLREEDFPHHPACRSDHREGRPVDRPVFEEAPPELVLAANVDPARLKADLLAVDLILGQVVASGVVQLLHLTDRGFLPRGQCQLSSPLDCLVGSLLDRWKAGDDLGVHARFSHQAAASGV